MWFSRLTSTKFSSSVTTTNTNNPLLLHKQCENFNTTSTTTTTTTTNMRRQPVKPSSFIVLLILSLIILALVSPSYQYESPSSSKNSPILLNRVSALITWNSDGITLKANTVGLNEDDKQQNCFYWSTLHPDLVSLVPVDNIETSSSSDNSHVISCSQEIQVIPKGHHTNTRVAIVKASRYPPSSLQSSSPSASCEVFISTIDKIKLQTTVRKLTIGELETLQVDAFDSEGNLFSSLTGLSFIWKQEGLKTSKKQGNIELIDINDESVHFFDEKKRIKRSVGSHDVIVAKGLLSGEVLVSVSLRTTTGQVQLLHDSVVISVVDSFVLQPDSELRVIPGAVIPFKLFIKQNGKSQMEIIMPDAKYVWSSTNTTVGEVERSKGIFKALDLGDTNVNVEDNTFALNRATGLVHVVKPAFIKINISPKKLQLYRGYDYILKNFKNSLNTEHNSLVLDNDYEVKIELFDQQYQKIYITQNLKFKFEIESSETEPITILERSVNEDLFLVRAKKLSDVVLRVTLKTADLSSDIFPGHNEDIELSHTKSISILPRVKIDIPDEIIYLPSDRHAEQMFILNAHGGSGLLSWTSSSPSVSPFDIRSQKETNSVLGVLVAKKDGKADVIVFDQQNLYNGDVRAVSISPLHGLVFEKGIREVVPSQSLCLRAKGLDINGNVFHNISSLSFEWNIVDTNVYSIVSQSCKSSKNIDAEIYLNAIAEGFTSIKIRYQNGKIQEKTNVAVFPPLAVTEPSPKKYKLFLIPLGATASLSVEGGPQPWDSYVKGESVIVDNVVSEDPDRLKISKSRASDMYRKRTFSVTCLDFGKQVLSVEIKHNIPAEDALPTLTKLDIHYSCQKPESLKVVPLDPKTKLELGLISSHIIRVYSVRNNQTIPAVMNAYDSEENLFITTSTLHDEWELSHENIAKISQKEQYPGHRLLDIYEKEGTVNLRGQIIGYNKDEVKKYVSHSIMNAAISAFSKPLEDEVELRIAPNIYLNPANYLLFRNRKVSLTLQATGGSGRYDFSHNNTDVATLAPKGSTAELVGIVPGYVRVDVFDTFSKLSPAASSFIKVADAYHVSLDGERFVEVDNSVTIKLSVIDEIGEHFPPSQHFAMQTSIEMDTPNIVTLKQSETNPDEYVLNGRRVGVVRLVASVLNADGRRVFSTAFMVNVYEPMRVIPPELVLIPGAKFQVKVTGGPIETPHIATVFKFKEDHKFASVDSRGIVTGLVYGEQLLIVEKVSLSRNSMVYARKTVPVRVVQLVGIKLPQPLFVFEGHHIPVPVYGVYDNKQLLSPLFMQSPYFQVSVSSVDQEISLINYPQSKTGHSVFISGAKIGKSQITASSTFQHPHLSSWNHNTKADIQVDDKLKLLDFPHKDLILAPRSATFRLRTNKDNLSIQKYSVAKTDEYDNLVTVSKNGDIVTRESEGISVVIVEEISTGQTVAQKVAVQNPHYLAMILNDIQSRSFDYDFQTPIGSEFEIPLSALGIRGEKFASVSGIDIQIRMNIHDVVSAKVDAQREAVVVYSNSIGNTTLELSAPELKQPYYCRISVVTSVPDTLSSTAKLHVGDSFTFMSATPGKWESSDIGVVSVDLNGVGTAHKVGSATVTFKSPSRTSFQIQVNVVRIAQAKISLGSVELSTGVDPIKQLPTRIPLLLLDNTYQEVKFPYDSRVRRSYNVQCETTQSWLEVVGTEKHDDKYECLIRPKRESYLSGDLKQLSTQDISLSVKVSFGEYAKSYNLVTTPITVRFTSNEARQPPVSREQVHNTNQNTEDESTGYFTFIILSLIIGVLGFVVYGSMNSGVQRPAIRRPSVQASRGMDIMNNTLIGNQEKDIIKNNRPFTHSNNSRFNYKSGARSTPSYASPYYSESD